MAQRVHLGRGAWEYDAPMYHDFEQSSPSYENCSVDKWFDTSATKGLRSPVSGGSKENDGSVQEVTSKVGKPATVKRKALGNVTNTIQMMDPVVGKTTAVKKTVTVDAKTVRSQPKDTLQAARSKNEVAIVEKKQVQKMNSEAPVETVRRPVTRSQKKQSSLTVPKSPKLMSTLRSGMHRKVVKSSEELELEEIERKRMEIQSRKGKRNPAGKNKDSGIDEQPAKRTRLVQKNTSVAHVAGSFTVGKSVDSTKDSTQTRTSRKRPARPKLTMPKSPNFATTRRARPPRFKSTEELELEMIAKVKFKAKPVNKRIISKDSAPKTGQPQKKSLTVPEPFSFATDKRVKQPLMQKHTVSSKPFVFGEGPVTRSKAKHIVTVGTRKKEMPQKHVAPVVDTTPVCVEPTEISARPELPKTRQPMAVVRPVTRGSLLKGGAMRVVRKDDEVFESSPEEIPRVEAVCEESIESEDYSVAKIEYDKSATFDNPLFRP